jgi:hypothetical protein
MLLLMLLPPISASQERSSDNRLVPSATQLTSQAAEEPPPPPIVESNISNKGEELIDDGTITSLRRRSDIASVPRKGMTDARKGMIPLLPGEIGDDDDDDDVPTIPATPIHSSTLMVASTPTDAELDDSLNINSPVGGTRRLKVVAMFDFPGVEEGDLPFEEGDVFEADADEFESQSSEAWITGWNNGQVGMFPSNYVERYVS